MGLVYCYLRGRLHCIYCDIASGSYVGIKTGSKNKCEFVNKVGSKIESKKNVLAFLKCMDRSVLAFLKFMDGSVLVSLKCMDGSVLANLRFSIQSAPTRFPHLGKLGVP